MSENNEEQRVVVDRVNKNVTIQKTNKTFKVMMLLGWLCLIGGIVLMAKGLEGAGLLAGGGVLLIIVGKIGKWWAND